MRTANQSQEDFHVDLENVIHSDECLESCISTLLSSFHAWPTRIERRSNQRYPFPHLLHLTPLGADGTPSGQDPIVVVGKHLSEQGLGFYHTNPLPYRRMIVSFETGNGSWLSFLIDLTWCRFTKQGWYESGGRFLQTVETPDTVNRTTKDE